MSGTYSSVDRVSVDTIGRYGDWHSADLGRHIDRHQPISMSVDTRPIHFTTTRPPLGRYFTNTRTTLHSLGQLLLLSSIFSTQLREAFSGHHRPFLAFNSGNIHVFFPALFFPRHRFYIRPSLLSEVAAFGACCFRRFVILGELKF